jgi:protein gp37
VSQGCDHCYAETFARRWRGVPGHPFEQGFDVRVWPARLTLPLRWRAPKRVFVNSMSDLWHTRVDTDLIARVFAVMALAQRHTFQVLTKRPARMRSLLDDGGFWELVRAAAANYGPVSAVEPLLQARALPNLWLGCPWNRRAGANLRLDTLADTTTAAVRFVSCEPLLGELDLRAWLGHSLGWVIVGGESGPGARPMHPQWARGLRDQCQGAGVAFFYKQAGPYEPAGPVYRRGETAADWDDTALELSGTGCVVNPDGTQPLRWDSRRVVVSEPPQLGAWWMAKVGKTQAGRLLDGRTWDEFPRPAQGSAGS